MNMNLLFDKQYMGCIFCNIKEEGRTDSSKYAFVVRDRFPVTQYHSLIIPYRHIESYFDLDKNEIDDCNKLLFSEREKLIQLDRSITGFNIGINNGKSAGQTVFHCHIHLIPRRDGDVENPRGGVRHIIPGKGSY